MAVYRCYFLDREDHITGRTELNARSLSDAIHRARKMLEKRPQQHSFEIWEGAQRLYPEHPERNASAFHSAEETAKRLEALLGNLAGARREPRPHKSLGRRRTPPS